MIWCQWYRPEYLQFEVTYGVWVCLSIDPSCSCFVLGWFLHQAPCGYIAIFFSSQSSPTCPRCSRPPENDKFTLSLLVQMMVWTWWDELSPILSTTWSPSVDTSPQKVICHCDIDVFAICGCGNQCFLIFTCFRDDSWPSQKPAALTWKMVGAHASTGFLPAWLPCRNSLGRTWSQLLLKKCKATPVRIGRIFLASL